MNGKRSTYSGVLPWTGLYSTAEIGIAMLRIDEMTKTVPLDAPWNASKAVQWDNQSVQTWMDANLLAADAKSLLRLAVLALLSVEPRDISLLYMLFYIQASGRAHHHAQYGRRCTAGPHRGRLAGHRAGPGS